MKKITLILSAALLLCPAPSFAWGGQVHAAIGRVADNHLTPKTRAELNKYIGTLSLADIASDADRCRGVWTRDFGVEIANKEDFRLRHTFLNDSIPSNIEPWTHSLVVDENFECYHTDLMEIDGKTYGLNNCVFYIEKFAKELRENAAGMDKETAYREIALITHWLGDMHCPMHIQYFNRDMYKGHMKFKISIGGEPTSLHGWWDGGLLKTIAYPAGFEDVARYADRNYAEDYAEVTKGDIYDWGSADAKDAWEAHVWEGKPIVDYEAEGLSVKVSYAEKMRPLCYRQIRNAGWRLAALLNSIFDN